jgi:hypothetical protein
MFSVGAAPRWRILNLGSPDRGPGLAAGSGRYYQDGECGWAGKRDDLAAEIPGGKGASQHMDTSESAAAFEDELRVVEEDLAWLREAAADLRRRIGEREDEPTDPAERSAMIEQAEEQEALIDVFKARREELLRDLGRPGTAIGPAGRPLLSGPASIWPRPP